MKAKRTPQSKRDMYIYTYQNGDKAVIRPGENGVTKEAIRQLHALDDKEVHSNSKYVSVPQTDEEREKIREWEEQHPGEEYPEKKNISLDFCMENVNTAEAREVLAETSTYDRELSPDVQRLRELVEELPDFQRKVYQLVFVEGYSYSKAAEILNVSKPRIEKNVNKIRNYIKQNF